jgi:SAM-dependent methyltransferase
MSTQVALSSSTAWYDSPLYYDMVYEDYTKRETRFLNAVVKKYGNNFGKSWRILEPACGSGRLLESLARLGHTVHGFDRNRNQVAYAKKRLKGFTSQTKVWQDSLQDFRTPKPNSYDLVHCFVTTFKYLLKEKDAVTSLRLMSKALRPGGLCLIGLHLTDYKDNPADYERWVNRRGDVKVVSETWSDPARIKKRLESMRTRMTITEKGKTRVEETLWDFRTYSASELKSLLSKIKSFELIACHDFHYNIKQKRQLDNAYSDIILVLRKTR